MSARHGGLYEVSLADGGDVRANAVVVLGEDPWNRAMNGAVIVPIYEDRGEPGVGGMLRPLLAQGYADCTRIQTLDDDDRGDDLGDCAPLELDAIKQGVRAFLDLDDLGAQRIRRPPAVGRSGFWPRQRGVYWGPSVESAPQQHERHAVVPSDEHNIRADYTAAVFMTSRNKNWRSRWQVPRTGGWAITGDIDIYEYDEFNHRDRPSPSELNRQEMAEVARGIEQMLKL